MSCYLFVIQMTLINNQNDTDLARKAIPELMKLMNDKDQMVASHAAMMVQHFSKKKLLDKSK